MDDVATCAREGRILISNIRGLTEQRIREHAPKVASGFQLIHLRNDVPSELFQLRRWWHWAPAGAFLILDEVPALYPPEWSKADLAKLDMKYGRRINGNGIPKDLGLVFDMHRHGNWDITYTTPSIKRVRPEIRAAAECAYKHKNLALHGAMFKGKFLQMQHLAEDNGSPSEIFVKRSRKIQPWVFKCYESTATGQVSDTKVGLSLLASPKLLLLLGVVVVCIVTALSVGRPKSLGGGGSEVRPVSGEAPDAPPAGVRRSVQAGGSESKPAAVTVVQRRTPDMYRLLGVTVLPRFSYAVAYSPATGDIRIPLSACRKDPYAGWWCSYDGQIVSPRSGTAPPKEQEEKTFLAQVVKPEP